MSDYISKSALLKHLWDWRLQECPVGVCDEETETYKAICECIDAVKDKPTLDEKEIIRKAFERVVERLEEKYNDIPIQYENNYEKGIEDGIDYAMKIVKEEGGIE